MKITIITDGNSQLGMGHVYQSLTLAKKIQKKHNLFTIVFYTKSDASISSLINDNGFVTSSFFNDDGIFVALKEFDPEVIIFDKLDVEPILAEKIKTELKKRLIIFTNLTAANNYADVTVMASMGSDFKNIYKRDENSGRVEFWGPKYLFLRPEFSDYKYREKPEVKEVTKVMLMFGGADPANLSTNVLNELLKMKKAFDITLVLGNAFIFQDQVQTVINSSVYSLSKVTVLHNLKDVAKTMFNNHVVFVSPGLSFFEALSVKTPVVCFHQNKFQEEAWKGHIPTLDIKEIDSVPDIINNKKFIFPHDDFISRLQIGDGAEDIISEIFNFRQNPVNYES